MLMMTFSIDFNKHFTMNSFSIVIYTLLTLCVHALPLLAGNLLQTTAVSRSFGFRGGVQSIAAKARISTPTRAMAANSMFDAPLFSSASHDVVVGINDATTLPLPTIMNPKVKSLDTDGRYARFYQQKKQVLGEKWDDWQKSGDEIKVDMTAITRRKLELEKIKEIDPQTPEITAFLKMQGQRIQEAEAGLKTSIAASHKARVDLDRAEKEFLLYGQIDQDALDRISKLIKDKEALEANFALPIKE